MEQLSWMKCPHCGERLAYKVFMVSPTEVLSKKKGYLAQMQGPLRPKTRQNELFLNRKILTDYINDMGKKGWEFISMAEYSGIPYNGALIFRRAILAAELELINKKEEERIDSTPREKVFELLRSNRKNEKQGRTREHTVKTKIPDSMKQELDIDKKSIGDAFDTAYEQVKVITEPNVDDPMAKMREAENKAMLEKLASNEHKEYTPSNSEEIEDSSLMSKYEAETGNHAVWHGKVTQQFKEWKKDFEIRKQEIEDLKAEEL